MRKKALFLAMMAVWGIGAQGEEIPAGYYDRIYGQHDAQLKDSLRAVIRPHTAIAYGSGTGHTWEVFYYSDRDPQTGEMMDMYCDTWHVVSTPGAVASGCNIEHSFAKSWWGGAEWDAYKDCHHLNPSNGTANSARSNYPLGNVVTPTKTAGSLKIGMQHHDSLNTDFYIWEPKDEYKGDFARAYFYMATCYGHDAQGNCPDLGANNKKQYPGWRIDNKDVGARFAMRNDSYLEFQDWEIAVLLAWHRQDSVSAKERMRQDGVSDFQHNRNPYIDMPELVEYIWGEHKGECYFGQSPLTPLLRGEKGTSGSARKEIRDGRLVIVVGERCYTPLGGYEMR